jgi:hypothetical protein
LTIIIYLLFIFAGFFFVYALSGFQIHVQGQEIEVAETEDDSESEAGKVLYSKTFHQYAQFEEDVFNYSLGSSKKLVIEESVKIYSDRSEAETGEEVQFWATLKNNGLKMKHLTHVCFNHSGGVTFSCLEGPQGPNIDPGREFPIHGTTKFLHPGKYSVWLTWSQDETNFYNLNKGGTVSVTVY